MTAKSSFLQIHSLSILLCFQHSLKNSLSRQPSKYQKRASEGLSSLEFWCWITLFYKIQVQPQDLDINVTLRDLYIYKPKCFLCIIREWKMQMIMRQVTSVIHVLSLLQHRASCHNPLSLPLSYFFKLQGKIQ